MYTKLLAISILVLALSCKPNGNSNEDPPIARVYDNYLYKSQVKGVVPAGLSEEDSLLVVRDYIEKWIRKQLLFHQADIQLTEEEKNVEDQINDYKTSLLIFKYEQSYIKNNLDTVISDQEVEDYYNNNSSNFILDNHLIKGRFIKVDRSAPDISKLRRWYKSDDAEHIKELESYCYNNAEIYKYFEEKWINFSEVLGYIPELYTRPENILRYRKHLETRDTTSYYFLKITDYRLASTIAPLEYKEDDIRSILINKRKIQLIQQLESNVYNDALNRDHFNIY